jgi:hypothetical protein
VSALENQRWRGWVTIGAGVVMIAVIGCVWIWVAHLVATRGIGDNDAGAAQFMGKTYVAFALIVLSGALGILIGVGQLRSGKRNRALTFAMAVSFVAAVIVATTSSVNYLPAHNL